MVYLDDVILFSKNYQRPFKPPAFSISPTTKSRIKDKTIQMYLFPNRSRISRAYFCKRKLLNQPQSNRKQLKNIKHLKTLTKSKVFGLSMKFIKNFAAERNPLQYWIKRILNGYGVRNKRKHFNFLKTALSSRRYCVIYIQSRLHHRYGCVRIWRRFWTSASTDCSRRGKRS